MSSKIPQKIQDSTVDINDLQEIIIVSVQDTIMFR